MSPIREDHKLPADPLECAFIALGSNLPSEMGDPAGTLQWAIMELQNLSTRRLQVSSLYQSEPLECPPGSPSFLNQVVALYPLRGETALGLLCKLQHIEEKAGRVRSSEENAPRELDLDLITFMDSYLQRTDLTIPHARCQSRRFVLEPLMEIAGDITLPGDDQPISAYLETVRHQPLSRLPATDK